MLRQKWVKRTAQRLFGFKSRVLRLTGIKKVIIFIHMIRDGGTIIYNSCLSHPTVTIRKLNVAVNKALPPQKKQVIQYDLLGGVPLPAGCGIDCRNQPK